MPGLYIHIPFCKKKCDYCAFSSISGADCSFMHDYIDALMREMKEKADLAADIEFNTVFVGGGTPSMLPEEMFYELIYAARQMFRINEAEFTCECNPESAHEALFETWREHGVNRISIGVQSFDDATLARIGRIHDSAQAKKAIKMAFESGFERVSVDIMCALPGQSRESFLETISTAVSLGIGHVSCYQLEIEEGTPLSNAVKEGSIVLKTEDEAADEMAAAAAALEAAGFLRYEVSNFAKPGQECIHNRNYWRRGDYLGLGCSAHSFIGGARRGNTSDIMQYVSGDYEKSFEIISESAAAEETIMLGLRMAEGADMALLTPKMRQNAQTLAEHGILSINDNRVRATARGIDVLNQAILFVIK